MDKHDHYEHGVGPVYSVPLIDVLPLNPLDPPHGFKQQMPSGDDLQAVRQRHERVVAGYEVLLHHWRWQRREIERLQGIVDANLHVRRCHDCGHEFYAADGVVPYCLCDKCGSQDTRKLPR